MIKIGIIAGGGKLPLAVGESLIKSKFDVVFFCLERNSIFIFIKKN